MFVVVLLAQWLIVFVGAGASSGGGDGCVADLQYGGPLLHGGLVLMI